MRALLSRRGAVAFLLAAGVAMAGCGSSATKSSSTTTRSGTSPATGSSGTSATTVAATGATINVGEVCTCTAGAGGSTNDVPNAVTAWAAYLNTHGGVNGHPVKVYYEDDADDPAKSISEVHQMVSGNHVVAILDASSQDAAWVSFVTAQKVPVISLDQAADGFQFVSQPDYFANGTTVITILWGQLKAAAEAGATTYGFIYCTEAPACAQAAPATKALAPSIPIKVTYVAKASNSQPDYTAVCLGAKQAPAAALFPAGVTPKRVADDCVRQGYKPIWITSQGTVAAADITDPNLSTATGDLQDFPWMLNATPGSTALPSSGGSRPRQGRDSGQRRFRLRRWHPVPDRGSSRCDRQQQLANRGGHPEWSVHHQEQHSGRPGPRPDVHTRQAQSRHVRVPVWGTEWPVRRDPRRPDLLPDHLRPNDGHYLGGSHRTPQRIRSPEHLLRQSGPASSQHKGCP